VVARRFRLRDFRAALRVKAGRSTPDFTWALATGEPKRMALDPFDGAERGDDRLSRWPIRGPSRSPARMMREESRRRQPIRRSVSPSKGLKAIRFGSPVASAQ